MNAEGIIRKKANPEIFPVSQIEFAKTILEDMDNFHVFQYGSVVFTVSKDMPIVHIYADESGHGLIRACSEGLKEVWDVIEYNYLIAPIINPRVKKLAKRFGWMHHRMDRTGYEIFYILRGM